MKALDVLGACRDNGRYPSANLESSGRGAINYHEGAVQSSVGDVEASIGFRSYAPAPRRPDETRPLWLRASDAVGGRVDRTTPSELRQNRQSRRDRIIELDEATSQARNRVGNVSRPPAARAQREGQDHLGLSSPSTIVSPNCFSSRISRAAGAVT